MQNPSCWEVPSSYLFLPQSTIAYSGSKCKETQSHPRQRISDIKESLVSQISIEERYHFPFGESSLCDNLNANTKKVLQGYIIILKHSAVYQRYVRTN